MRDWLRVRTTDEIWQSGSQFLPVVLAILGGAVTLWPPNTAAEKVVWLVVFILVGLAAFIANSQDRRITRSSHRRLFDTITGGKSFCYFWLDPKTAGSGSDGLLTMVATAPLRDMNYWISPAAANRDVHDPLYGSIDRQKPMAVPVHEGRRLWPRRLPPGDYIVEFDATTGLKHWVEHLSWSRVNGTISQSIRVEDGEGRTVFEHQEPVT